MRTFSNVAAVLAVVGILTAVASAEIVFFDDFNSGPAGNLQGHVANTGQTWSSPIFGAVDAEITNVVGQGGSLGAAVTSNSPSMGTQIALNLPANLNPDVDGSGNITGGLWTFSVDFRRGSTDGLQIGLNTSGVGTQGLPNWGWKCGGNCGAPIIETQGSYSPNVATTVQYATGDLHLDVVYDLDAGTQSIEWYDPNDRFNPATSGLVDLGAFNHAAAVPPWTINHIWYAGSGAGGDLNGVDNVTLRYGLIPEPAAAVMLAVGALTIVARRRRSQA